MNIINNDRMTKIISVVLAVILGVLVVSFVANAVTTISTNVDTDGNLVVDGTSTLTGLTSMIQASSTRFSVHNKLYVGGSSTTTIDDTGDISVAAGEVGASMTRTTALTGSFQTIWGDLTYKGAAGGTSGYHAGVMGNFLGASLTNTNATIHAGTIGKYSVTTSDDLVGPKAGLVGEAETSVANSAVMAVLGGDTGTVAPGAAYAVRYLNSTAASKFTYGLDLFSAAVGSYKAVDYGTADIRLQNGETISNATDGFISLGGKAIIAGAALGSHLRSTQTTAPTGTTGTCTDDSVSAGSTDMRGEITATCANQTAIVAFNVAYATAPVCTVTPMNAAANANAATAGFSYVVATTGITITQTATVGPLVYAYICIE